MKNIFSLLLIVLLIFSLSVGCSPTNAPVDQPDPTDENPVDDPTFSDGVYFAIEDNYDDKTGWKNHVVITVKNGKIVNAVWNGTNRIPSLDKNTQSENGSYGMITYGGAQAEWHTQAKATIDYFLELQSTELPEGFYKDTSGHTDAIAGVSIRVTEFFDLAAKALDSSPIPSGNYTDGYPYVLTGADSHGWQYGGQLIILNGTIVDANFNAVSISQLDENGKFADKKGLLDTYGMKNGGATYEWYEHANMVGEYVVATQGFDVNYIDDKGHTDSIAGVSIHVNEMETVFNILTSESKYQDGIYYASEEDYNANTGWKHHVVVKVQNGRIAEAKWDGTHRIPQLSKFTQSETGKYGMVEYGGAQAGWYDQAKATELYLLNTQTAEVGSDFYTDESGHTDAIAGVSIYVKGYFDLVKKALSAEPIKSGDYTDGYYSATLDPDSNGYSYTGEFIIVNGTIVSANFNASSTDNEGNPIDKKGLKENYGMKNSGAAMEWYEHANLVEDYVLTNQSFNVSYTDEEGHTDSIAGVSIHVNEMNEVFNKALGIE